MENKSAYQEMIICKPPNLKNKMEMPKLSGLIEILKETIKILHSKNGKLIAKITSIYIIIVSLATISYINLSSFLQHDLLAKETFLILNSPTPPSYTEVYAAVKPDLVLILGLSLFLNLFTIFLYVFTMTATILASAETYSSEKATISFKELMMKVKSSIKRPIITLLYIYLIGIGLSVIVLFFLGSLAFLIENRSVILPTAVVVGILASILWLYLYVVFQLGMTVSIIEEGICGIQAIAKAGRIVKGKRLYGFVFNLVVQMANLIAVIPFMKMNTNGNQSMVYKGIALVILSSFSGILAMFFHMFYTVLYFQCNKIHGKSETGLMGVYEYVKLPYGEVAVDQDLP
ncbi:uncharacterized protein LOC124931357 [Impatiens glandulifera]|uniref:uncharacterized protein LOC124931357 n=1 Tax=Impatiens glandulifera TaxID=253017 RepID=UPI001FB10AF7|nr:uncharacterized protein LOC124931357 [Impatiens glandulifera]